MPFVKGQSGNKGGRPKGSPDARRKFYDVQATLEAAGFDPVAAMLEIAMHSESNDLRYKATRDLIDKIAPALKSVEHKTDDTQHNDMLEQLKSAMQIATDKHKKEF